jgi:hypothetical protein
MPSPYFSSVLAASLLLTAGTYGRCDELIKKMPAESPARDSCDSTGNSSSTVTIPPQKICIEMSAPDVSFKQVAPTAPVEKPCLLKRCCHWFQKPCCVMPVAPMAGVQAVAPMTTSFAVQPQALAPAPLAIQPYSVAPLSVPSFSMQPTAMAAPFSVAPMSISPYSLGAQSFAVQPTLQLQATGSALTTPLALSIVQPQAKSEAAKAEAEKAASSAVNEALKKLSTSVQLLTKIVDRHADILLYHEKRLRVLESFHKPEDLEKKTKEIEDAMEKAKKKKNGND